MSLGSGLRIYLKAAGAAGLGLAGLIQRGRTGLVRCSGYEGNGLSSCELGACCTGSATAVPCTFPEVVTLNARPPARPRAGDGPRGAAGQQPHAAQAHQHAQPLHRPHQRHPGGLGRGDAPVVRLAKTSGTTRFPQEVLPAAFSALRTPAQDPQIAFNPSLSLTFVADSSAVLLLLSPPGGGAAAAAARPQQPAAARRAAHLHQRHRGRHAQHGLRTWGTGADAWARPGDTCGGWGVCCNGC